ncbi:MAG: hypothetical protein F4213_04510 [Boseongicola sp. SB0677_bin_26]|nr:hypothetical protein [Boseongicola sp. SB0665_bin_10]MYG25271.1 hypothetical protein [Boseongicola sp. SB0677_bin_26]
MGRLDAAELPQDSMSKRGRVSATEIPGFGPARQVNLREIVYDQLKDAFMVGYFAPGDHLNLRELANRF